MALNPIVFTEKVVRSFLRYQLTAYPFSDEGLHGRMRRLLFLDPELHLCFDVRALFPTDTTVTNSTPPMIKSWGKS